MTKQDLLSKATDLLGSIRFWILVNAAIATALKQVAGDGLSAVEVFEIIQAFMLAVAALGTADSIAKKISGSK